MAELNKLDEGVLDKVGAWLDQPEKMTTRMGLQLLVEMMSNVYQGQNDIIEHINKQNGRIGTLESEVKDLKGKSIVNWVEGHFKTSVLIFLGFIVFMDVIVDKVSSSNAIAMLGAFLKKWAGL